MPFLLDHVVHLTNQPENAVQEMNALGFHSNLGGHHNLWGTYNGLTHFGLSYLEFLGIENLSIAQSVKANTLISQTVEEASIGEGLIRLALRTHSIEKDAERFRSLGLNVIGPVLGSRLREDGIRLEWAMLFIDKPGENPYNYPFIIDWKVTDQERQKSLEDQGLLPKSLKTSLSGIGIYTENPVQTAKNWAELFGVTLSGLNSKELNYDQVVGKLGDVDLIFHNEDPNRKFQLTKRLVRPSFITLTGATENRKVKLLGATYILKNDD